MKATLLRRGKAFWQTLDEHAVPYTISRMPSNFPPVPCKGRTLSGLGTPDLLGSYGTFSYFTNDPSFTGLEVSGVEIYPVTVENGGLVLRLTPNPDMVADLTHWHYDTFLIKWRKPFPWWGDGWVQFLMDNRGKVTELKLDVPNDDLWFWEPEFRKRWKSTHVSFPLRLSRRAVDRRSGRSRQPTTAATHWCRSSDRRHLPRSGAPPVGTVARHGSHRGHRHRPPQPERLVRRRGIRGCVEDRQSGEHVDAHLR